MHPGNYFCRAFSRILESLGVSVNFFKSTDNHAIMGISLEAKGRFRWQ